MKFFIKKMINKIIQIVRHERLSFAVIAIFRKFSEQLLGRGQAWLLGWHRGYLGPGSRVIGSRHISVGDRAYINHNAWIEAVHAFRGQVFTPAIHIGQGFSASDRLHISCVNQIAIGDHCLFGSGIYISEHNHGAYQGEIQSPPTQAPVDRALVSLGAVNIGSNVWLGDNVVIIGPVTIGNGAVVGANSVVKRDIPENVIMAGTPMRLIRQFDNQTGTWKKYEH